MRCTHESEASIIQSKQGCSWRGIHLRCFARNLSILVLVLDSFISLRAISAQTLIRMSAMKDITNYSPITAMAHHERPADENVFIATRAGTPSSGRSPWRATNKRIIPAATSNGEMTGDAIREECDMSSVFMTPTEDRHFFCTEDSDTEGCPVRKRLRLATIDREVIQPVPLPIALNGLTKVQLVNLVNNLVNTRHPELEEELRELIPEPDLGGLESKLKSLQHNIYKSFPHTRSYGSPRDASCYRRVASHLTAFKKQCIEEGETLLACQLWEWVVEYVLMAWPHVCSLPTWDSPAHNKSKEQCFKQLAVQCNKALKMCQLSPQEWIKLETRLKQACQKKSELQPCLDQVQGILKDMSPQAV